MSRLRSWYAPGTVSPLASDPTRDWREVRISLLNCFALDGGFAGSSIGRGAARDLLCYLSLFRDRPHPRELLLEALWSDLPPDAARKRLRQALWRLKTALGARALVIEPSSVSYGEVASLDLEVFEQTYRAVSAREPSAFKAADAHRMQQATRMYGGGLLPGMYQEWCIAERERLREMHLLMLELLMGYFEVHHDNRTAISYGESILRVDPAHELTHQRLILLRHAAGDRTGALRQFRRCASALEQELGVGVSRATLDVLRRIESDEPTTDSPQLAAVAPVRSLV